MPSVNRLHTELKGRGLEVVLVTFRESPELVARTVRERGYVAPVLIDASGEVTGKLYGVFGPPTAYLIDRKGQLVARIVGERDWSTPEARAVLGRVLEERGSAKRADCSAKRADCSAKRAEGEGSVYGDAVEPTANRRASGAPMERVD